MEGIGALILVATLVVAAITIVRGVFGIDKKEKNMEELLRVQKELLEEQRKNNRRNEDDRW